MKDRSLHPEYGLSQFIGAGCSGPHCLRWNFYARVYEQSTAGHVARFQPMMLRHWWWYNGDYIWLTIASEAQMEQYSRSRTQIIIQIPILAVSCPLSNAHLIGFRRAGAGHLHRVVTSSSYLDCSGRRASYTWNLTILNNYIKQYEIVSAFMSVRTPIQSLEDGQVRRDAGSVLWMCTNSNRLSTRVQVHHTWINYVLLYCPMSPLFYGRFNASETPTRYVNTNAEVALEIIQESEEDKWTENGMALQEPSCSG